MSHSRGHLRVTPLAALLGAVALAAAGTKFFGAENAEPASRPAGSVVAPSANTFPVSPSNAAAEDAPVDHQIAVAIANLGSSDGPVRARASAALGALGRRAVPALRRAAKSSNPVSARNARNILEDIRTGLVGAAPELRAALAALQAAPGDPERLAALAQFGPAAYVPFCYAAVANPELSRLATDRELGRESVVYVLE